ncbi:MAG TPA: cytochrome c biogenesis protein CcsA [Burkholderiales bacterium]|nr:cytochrome c biogenesis protein CcsA [Burkholderiales bacterium]
MPDIVIHGIASAAYLILAWHFWNTRWRAGAQAAAPHSWERAALVVPVALHAGLLYSGIFGAAELRFGFAQALSVMMFLAALMCWLETFLYPVEALYPLVLGAAAICAPLPAFFTGRHLPDAVPFEFRLHLVFGMLAYSLFTVAMLHAVLISKVEHRLHGTPGLGGPLAQLPPLLSLERMVFWLIGAAFAVLSVTLVLGMVYSEEFLGRLMRFEHKTVFVVLSWLIFGLLLAGRWRYGWRGRTAVRWTLVGFVVLMLGYPGSRFVLEVLLHRA